MYAIVWLLLTLHLGALILPGPDFAVTLRYSLVHGRQAAVACACGIAIGVMINALISFLLGRSLLNHFPLLYIGFVLMGLMYLTYSGICLIRHATPTFSYNVSVPRNHQNVAAKQPFLTGMWTNISNVKAIVFFNSTLPLVTPLNGMLQSITWIGIGLLTAGWFSLVATFLSNEKVRTLFFGRMQLVEKVVGSVLILFSLGIFLKEVF